VKRYDVYLARLDPVEGTEMGNTRPVVIVSDDLRNRALPKVVCSPLTKQLHPDWRSRWSHQPTHSTSASMASPVASWTRRRNSVVSLTTSVAEAPGRDTTTSACFS